MKTKTIIPLILGSVLIMGLVSCADKTKQPSKASPKPWQLSEPQLKREDQRTIRISELEEKVTELKIGDQLIFSETTFARSPIVLKAKTACQFNERKLTLHESSRTLKSSHYLYEFLPKEAFLDVDHPDSKGLRCHFQFMALTSNGSTHRFQISLSQVDSFSFPVTDKNILLDRVPVANSNSRWLEVSIKELTKLNIVDLSPDTQMTELICQRFTGHVPTQGGLSDFQNIRWPSREAQLDATKKAQFCRLISLDKNELITNLSRLFILRGEGPDVVAERLSRKESAIIKFGEPIPDVGSYRITNHSESTVVVGVPFGLRQGIALRIYAKTDIHREPYTTSLETPTLLVVSGNNIDSSISLGRFDLKPHGSIEFELHQQHNRIDCPSKHLFVGYYQSPLRTEGLHYEVYESGFDPAQVGDRDASQIDIQSIRNLEEPGAPLWKYTDPNCNVMKCEAKGQIIAGPDISNIPFVENQCKFY